MQHHVEKLAQSRMDILDDSSRKRGLPVEPTDGLDNAKRARLDAPTPVMLKIPPLPEGPLSYAQLYTLTEDVGLSSFDVKQLPADLVTKIAVPVLSAIDPSLFSQAIDVGHPFDNVCKTCPDDMSRPFAADSKRSNSDNPHNGKPRRLRKKTMTTSRSISQWT